MVYERKMEKIYIREEKTKYLLILHGGADSPVLKKSADSPWDDVLRDIPPEEICEVTVSNDDELRGAIELIGDEISEKRGVFFLCDGVEIPDEDDF